MKDEALAERCRALKLILTDVDGVMTDGTVLGDWQIAAAAVGASLPG
jgi:3-deoxy-D-manno-octulosonate 8-phosphate phosphatase KdsC-like HAD superfamily phosphatase